MLHVPDLLTNQACNWYPRRNYLHIQGSVTIWLSTNGKIHSCVVFLYPNNFIHWYTYSLEDTQTTMQQKTCCHLNYTTRMDTAQFKTVPKISSSFKFN